MKTTIKVETSYEKPDMSGFDIFACPKCGEIFCSGEFVRLTRRCPKCKVWVISSKQKCLTE